MKQDNKTLNLLFNSNNKYSSNVIKFIKDPQPKLNKSPPKLIKLMMTFMIFVCTTTTFFFIRFYI